MTKLGVYDINVLQILSRISPMAVSGMAKSVFSVATRNRPWTDKPTPWVRREHGQGENPRTADTFSKEERNEEEEQKGGQSWGVRKNKNGAGLKLLQWRQGSEVEQRQNRSQSEPDLDNPQI